MIKGRIGLEIECFYLKTSEKKINDYCKKNKIIIENDGSININGINEDNRVVLNSENYITHELKMHSDIKNLNKILSIIKGLFDLGIKINASCGLHIHISFKHDVNYYKLLNFEFIQQFQNKISDLLTSEYEKLRLNNHYCSFYNDDKDFKIFSTQQILCRSKGGSRFKAVNFNAFNCHKTIEFRIFPATTNLNTLKKYVGFLLQNIEDYLSNSKKIEMIITENIKPIQNKPIIITLKKEQQTTDNNIQSYKHLGRSN